MQSERYPIVICGGGVAGLILAIRLRQLGLSPVVIEKQRGIRPQPKGEFFQPQAITILREIGLLDRFLTKATKIRRLSHVFRDPLRNRRHKISFRYENYNGIDYGLSILHEDILLVLREEFQRLGGDFREGVFVRDFTEQQDGCLLDLSDGREVHAEFFVGADGRYSATRKMAGIELVETPCSRMMMAVLLEGLTVPAGEFYTEEVPGGILYAFRSSADLVRAYICFDQSEFETANADRERFFFSKMASTSLRGRKSAKVIGQIMIMPTLDFMATRMHTRRAIWFGDAAGAVDPLGGHGMAVAIADAIRIADTLKRCSGLTSAANLIIDSDFNELNQISRQEYLNARFVGKWIGTILMDDSVLSRLTKWKAMRVYERDPHLKAYFMELFSGMNRSALGLYELPYLLGYFPTRGKKLLKSLRFDRVFIDQQNFFLTSPLNLLREKFTTQASELASRLLGRS